MIQVFPGNERLHTEIGWLDSRHTFSFGEHYDPDRMGFRALRVINDDRVHPGRGFGTHPHRDMEILSYVVDGALEHRDSMGNGGIIRPGDLQRMSAGTGVAHSEWNPDPKQPVRFLQIWILPERKGLAPGYGQKSFPVEERRGRLRLVASKDGAEGSIAINRDMRLHAGILDEGTEVGHSIPEGRHAFVQVVKGAVSLGGDGLDEIGLEEGDGVALSEVPGFRLRGQSPSAEVLVFDLD